MMNEDDLVDLGQFEEIVVFDIGRRLVDCLQRLHVEWFSYEENDTLFDSRALHPSRCNATVEAINRRLARMRARVDSGHAIKRVDRLMNVIQRCWNRFQQSWDARAPERLLLPRGDWPEFLDEEVAIREMNKDTPLASPRGRLLLQRLDHVVAALPERLGILLELGRKVAEVGWTSHSLRWSGFAPLLDGRDAIVRLLKRHQQINTLLTDIAIPPELFDAVSGEQLAPAAELLEEAIADRLRAIVTPRLTVVESARQAYAILFGEPFPLRPDAAVVLRALLNLRGQPLTKRGCLELGLGDVRMKRLAWPAPIRILITAQSGHGGGFRLDWSRIS